MARYRTDRNSYALGVYIPARPGDPTDIEVPDGTPPSRYWEPLDKAAEKDLNDLFASDKVRKNEPKKEIGPPTSPVRIPVQGGKSVPTKTVDVAAMAAANKQEPAADVKQGKPAVSSKRASDEHVG